MQDFDIVELVAWTPPSAAVGQLREVAFRANAWLPSEDAALRTAFASDIALRDIARLVGRTLPATRQRIQDLGLRRNSTRPWSALEDEELAQRYGDEATADLARDLGRGIPALYNRARLLGLSRTGEPAWTPWEDAQLRAGYEAGIPVSDLERMIGRTVAAIRTHGSDMGVRHANHPAGWSDEEVARALELAQSGKRYAAIRAQLIAEGFPARSKVGFGMKIRLIGYSRGWGRRWTAEEDDRLRLAYAQGDNLRQLARDLQRKPGSLRWRADELGLQGTHEKTAGWLTEPVWTAEDEATLRREYGATSTPALAARLGRGVRAVYQRAAHLGLKHGYHRPWEDIEAALIVTAWRTGAGLEDLAHVLQRDKAVVSKYAIRLGYRMSDPDRPASPSRVTPATPPLSRDALISRMTPADLAVKALALRPRGRAALSQGGAHV